jgi:hypothetical protein
MLWCPEHFVQKMMERRTTIVSAWKGNVEIVEREISRKLRPLRSQKICTWHRWDNIEDDSGKIHKGLVTVQKSVNELIEEILVETESMSMHLFNASWQHRQFTKLKEDLQEGTALLVLDFGQNYPCFYQDEAQQDHWFHHQVTVHPIVAYHRDSEGTLHK